METKDAVLRLRMEMGLSQKEFAEKLFVTRQAVSRWETGETTPTLDTLKRMAKIFGRTMDALLGHPSGCQSCGMLLEREEERGTEKDGGRSEEYCVHCYWQGEFTRDLDMEEMIELNLRDLDAWNLENGLNLTPQEAREMLREFLPTLKRWQTGG